ncbi:MAG: hypothetical protein ACRDY5_02310 [Acidimicrobiales bacterium]
MVRTAPRRRPSNGHRLGRYPRLLPIAAALAVAAALFGLVAAHASLAQGQFRLLDLERRADTEQARYEHLRLEVARLEAPSRVVAVAQERLGMVPPAAVTYLSPSGPVTGTTGQAPATEPAGGDDLEGATARWAGVKRELGRR